MSLSLSFFFWFCVWPDLVYFVSFVSVSHYYETFVSPCRYLASFDKTSFTKYASNHWSHYLKSALS